MKPLQTMKTVYLLCCEQASSSHLHATRPSALEGIARHFRQLAGSSFAQGLQCIAGIAGCCLCLGLGGPQLAAQRTLEGDALTRERTTTKLTDVPNRENLTDEQLKAARLTLFSTATEPTVRQIQTRMTEDREEDAANGWPRPGHRGGLRVRLTWADTATFTAWQTKYQGIPKIEERISLVIGPTAYEIPGDEKTAPSGRRYTEVQADLAEIAWLEAKGVIVTAAGSFTQDWGVRDTP